MTIRRGNPAIKVEPTDATRGPIYNSGGPVMPNDNCPKEFLVKQGKACYASG